MLDETEIVYKSSNPRWTTSFLAEYEYGLQILFFVDVFGVRGPGAGGISGIGGGAGGIGGASSAGSVSGASGVGSVTASQQKGLKFLGRAVFDVQDVLGMANHVKARRLRKGGVVFAHIEQQSPHSPPSRSLTSSSESPSANLRPGLTQPPTPSHNHRIFTLRLRAHSLVHTHS